MRAFYESNSLRREELDSPLKTLLEYENFEFSITKYQFTLIKYPFTPFPPSKSLLFILTCPLPAVPA
jgi:hypothetical protein